MPLPGQPNVLGGNGGGSSSGSGGASASALFTSTASATVANTTTETTTIGSGVGTLTIPANYFTVGAPFKIEWQGFFSSAAVDTLNIKIKAGSNVLGSTGAVAYGALTNKVVRLYAVITPRTIGASGTFIVNTFLESAGSALTPQDSQILNTATVTVDTTVTQVIDVTATWSTASASDTITGTNFTMYTVGSSAGAGGTVTSASVVTANGFGGSVATATTTPAITLTTSVNGMAKGNGTALSTAVAGTDYSVPSGVETFSGAKTFNAGKLLTQTGAANPSYAEGALFYDNTEKAVSYFNENSNVTVNLGQEQLIRVINSTGSTIGNGLCVYLSGATGGLPQITLATNTAEATARVAGVTTNSIANGATGYICVSGVVHGMDTSAFTVGATVYLSTAGGLTATAPTGSNYITVVGVVRVSSASVGELVVTPMGNRIASLGGSGTVTVVASGNLTSTALVTGGGSQTAQTAAPTATMDSSGNISTPGTLTVGNAATTAGAIVLTQGTTQSTGTTNITMQAPTGVTSYIITLPGTVGSTGLMQWTVSGSVATLSSVTTLPSNITVDGTNLVGYRGAPQNSQSAAYTTVLADAGKCIFHPASDANARTFTIDSNANVAYVIGTIIEFINMSANNVTIAITSDTMTLLPAGTTGSRTLAQYGRASAEKISATAWVISGNSALT